MNRKSKSSRLARKNGATDGKTRDIRQYYSSQTPGSRTPTQQNRPESPARILQEIGNNPTDNGPSSSGTVQAIPSDVTAAHSSNSQSQRPSSSNNIGSSNQQNIASSSFQNGGAGQNQNGRRCRPPTPTCGVVNGLSRRRTVSAVFGTDFVNAEDSDPVIVDSSEEEEEGVVHERGERRLPGLVEPASTSRTRESPSISVSPVSSPEPLFIVNSDSSDVDPDLYLDLDPDPDLDIATAPRVESQGFENSAQNVNSGSSDAGYVNATINERTRESSTVTVSESVISNNVLGISSTIMGSSAATLVTSTASTSSMNPEALRRNNVNGLSNSVAAEVESFRGGRRTSSDNPSERDSNPTMNNTPVGASESPSESVIMRSPPNLTAVPPSPTIAVLPRQRATTAPVATYSMATTSGTIATSSGTMATSLGTIATTAVPIATTSSASAEDSVEDMDVHEVQPSTSSSTVSNTTNLNDDSLTEDFQPAKVVSVSRVAAKIAAEKEAGKGESTAAEDSEGNEEGCSICFEMWTTSGKHRVVSLKCGHLFGQSCIVKWLKGQGQKCPQCNVPAKVTDVRVIYAKALKALDTSESERLRQDLEKEKEARRKLEMEAAELRLAHRLVADKCRNQQELIQTYQQQIASLRQGHGVTPTPLDENKNPRHGLKASNKSYLLEKSIVISEAGGCRVCACSVDVGLMVVSQPSPNQLFPGHGVKKLSCLDWRTAQYVSIHSKPIRDVAFHPTQPNHLLSASMDKTIKLTSLNSNTVIMTFTTPAPVWSCTFGSSSHETIAGLGNGQALVYDTRRPDDVLHTLSTGSRSPVVAVEYVNPDLNSNTFRPGGLLVGQLDRCSFHQVRPDHEPRVHYLPLEGALCSLSFQRTTRHLLASFRPSSQYKTVRHQLCALMTADVSRDPGAQDVMCTSNCVHTFNGGDRMGQLSRSTLFEHPEEEGKLLVCAGDEASLCAKIWDASEGRPLQKIKSQSAILDTRAFTFNDESFLTLLTDKALSVYKFS